MTLHVETPGDTQIIVRRAFTAPPPLVFRAHTDPALIPRWMNAIPGWTMPVVVSDPRPGGRIEYRWDDGEGGGLRIEGQYIELDPPDRILHVERMYVPEPTAENRIETLFEAVDGGTRMTMTMTLPDAEARRAMLATGMSDGMAMTYDQLDVLLAEELAS